MFQLNNKRVILAYKGPFSIQALSIFGNYIKTIPIEDPGAKTKLFKIFLELAQNVSYYSSEKCDLDDNPSIGIGTFILKDEDDHFVIITRNKIQHADTHKLMQYCNQINNLNNTELRDLKNHKLKNRKEYENSAHVGIIQLALLSMNRITFSFDQDDEHFEISVKINKRYDKEPI